MLFYETPEVPQVIKISVLHIESSHLHLVIVLLFPLELPYFEYLI